VLPGHPLARQVDEFLAAWRTRTSRATRSAPTAATWTGFTAHHDGQIAALSATPIRAFLGEMAGRAPATRKRKRAAVVSFCKWAVRHELLDASPVDPPVRHSRDSLDRNAAYTVAAYLA
jgi:integrase/recombinase XerD